MSPATIQVEKSIGTAETSSHTLHGSSINTTSAAASREREPLAGRDAQIGTSLTSTSEMPSISGVALADACRRR